MSSVGLVVALPTEAACLGAAPGAENPIELEQGALAWVCGIGAERAMRAARQLADRGVGALASFGVAGGLDPELDAGELVLAIEVVGAPPGSVHPEARAWSARVRERTGGALGAREGVLLQSERVVATVAEKAQRFRSSGACAVDMESGAVAAVAHERALPFLAVRAVCDPAGRAVPRASLVAVDERGRLRRAAFAGALARRPWELADLVVLHRGFRRAQASLRKLVELTGPALLGPRSPAS